MSIYKSLKTNNTLEKKGVTFELYGNRVTLARAGGSNTEFQTSITKKTQPFRRQIAAGTMEAETERRILREVYADTIILGWEVKVGDEWKSGIESPDGDVLPYSRANVLATLEALPELFVELQNLASSAQPYLEDYEAGTGNS